MNTIFRSAIVSWKTTVLGFLALIEAVAIQLQAIWDNNPDTVADWNLVVIAATAFIGLLFAKDANKTSEQHSNPRKRF